MTPEPRSLNLELLIKLLKMTTSSHDGEALSAMRKANDQLAKVGGDWASLLRGKVTVMADPFMSLDQPPSRQPPRSTQPPPARTPPPPPPPIRPTTFAHRINQYAGSCTHCGTGVDAGMGHTILQPSGSWRVFCQLDDSCKHDPSRRARPATTASRSAPQPRPRAYATSSKPKKPTPHVKFGSKSLDDLDNLI